MNGEVFVDTNVLVYAVADAQPKRAIAQSLLSENEIVVSTQVISEFVAVCLRKRILSGADTIKAAREFLDILRVTTLSKTTVEAALDLMETHRFSYWDSLIIAAAIESGCSLLYSEDLQDGQFISQRLTIRNPFISPTAAAQVT